MVWSWLDMQGASSCFVRQRAAGWSLLPPHTASSTCKVLVGLCDRVVLEGGKITALLEKDALSLSASPRRPRPITREQASARTALIPDHFPFLIPVPFLTRPGDRDAKPRATGSTSMIHPQGEGSSKKLRHAFACCTPASTRSATRPLLSSLSSDSDTAFGGGRNQTCSMTPGSAAATVCYSAADSLAVGRGRCEQERREMRLK
ncbi:hypothetical protein LZ30DRAFT_129687 [Colletotrichum cereale]|nr:hypothetical protein LZ30DRAFT_129687 [Colletotrichum cereale]